MHDAKGLQQSHLMAEDSRWSATDLAEVDGAISITT